MNEGKTEELVDAPAIEDVEEVIADDPDKNTTADPDAEEQEWGIEIISEWEYDLLNKVLLWLTALW